MLAQAHEVGLARGVLVDGLGGRVPHHQIAFFEVGGKPIVVFAATHDEIIVTELSRRETIGQSQDIGIALMLGTRDTAAQTAAV